jgi:Protein of unknown function (DUF2723)
MKSSTESLDSLGNPGWAVWLSGALPCAVYVCSAAGHSYWLDSGEFTAASVDLDIAHPPGHPLTALWGRAFCLLPLGPLAFRVAVGQALAAAIAAAALQVAFARTLRVLGLPASPVRALIALGASWIVAFSYGFWFQAVRAEVYALQAMLICLALERLVALAADRELRDVRPLYAAGFYLGLGLANHHFMSVLALPALAHGLMRALRARGARVLAWTLGAGSVGLTTYAYLPLRAAAEPPMDLGHPLGWREFLWVVSARVYARRIGGEATQPMDERFLDLVVILIEQFSYLGLPLALLGLYLALRRRELRALCAVWGVVALISLCGRAWLNPVRANPDVLGYMLPGFAGFVALALCAALTLLGALPERWQRRGALGLAIAALTLAAAQLVTTGAQASLASFRATDTFDQLRHAALPADAILLATTPETTFRHWDAEAAARLRGDVIMLPLPFLNYGKSAEVLARRAPLLRGLVGGYRYSERLEGAQLDGLVQAGHPLLVEADLRVAWPLFPRLLPEGLLYRVLAAAPAPELVQAAARARKDTLAHLVAQLGPELEQTETRRQLLWIYFMDALYYASQRQTSLALEAVRRGLALQPLEQQLLRLREILLESPERFELRAFVPDAG